MADLAEVPALPPTSSEGRSPSLRAWECVHVPAVRMRHSGGCGRCSVQAQRLQDPFFLGAGRFPLQRRELSHRGRQ